MHLLIHSFNNGQESILYSTWTPFHVDAAEWKRVTCILMKGINAKLM